ncbi:threonine synthase [Alloacidobacterium sp.]|uniref:threonine synthase n=1 Tax=Alloacidobacterium sp. TaxID=2951999 RepID=UPI002D28E035|nr:threonine synthase [Alloacidobacterium sp.]HYK37475.1 threonine synthase [Alloacidobacterium sp.]
MPHIQSLECSRCHEHVSADKYQTVCPKCAGSLYVRYDMDALKKTVRPKPGGLQSMWRYASVLPEVAPVTLGEGWTPMLPSRRNPNVLIKEEATNPTGAFKARGMSMAVSMTRHYGLRKLAVPSAGNAAGALAAYAAAAGIEAHIFMPKDVPFANYLEGVAYGANVTLVDGLISDCARIVAENIRAQRSDLEAGRLAPEDVWFDISSLKEPFRVEGKKTMGLELVEQLGWTYPDAVFYPTGGGVGLIGMWKAFEEMERLGWVSGPRPKMIAVQSSGCAPVAKAYKEGADVSKMFENAATFAAGLRVPKPYADYIILDIVRASGGTVVDLPDETILASLLDWSRNEGLLLSPEGATATAAYDHLVETGFLKRSDRVVIFNTGAGLKYVDMIAEAMNLARPDTSKLPERVPVGGIITPQ